MEDFKKVLAGHNLADTFFRKKGVINRAIRDKR